MRIRYLSFLSLLVPAFFLLSGCASVEAQQSRLRRARKRAGLVRPPGLAGRYQSKATQSPLAKT